MESGDGESEVDLDVEDVASYQEIVTSGAGRSGVPPKKRSQRQLACEEDEDEDEEAPHELTQVLPTKKKTKSSKTSGKIAVEQEPEVLEWYRQHPELYAKKSAKYLDSSYKTRVIKAKADEMGVFREYQHKYCFYTFLGIGFRILLH